MTTTKKPHVNKADGGTVWFRDQCMGIVELTATSPAYHPREAAYYGAAKWSAWRWPEGRVDYHDCHTFDRKRDAVAWVGGLDDPTWTTPRKS